MSTQADLLIGVTTVAQNAKPRFTPEMSLKDRLKICYRESFKEGNAWFVRHDDDDLRMRIGIGALMSIVEKYSDEYNTIETSIDALKSLSAALSGVPVDLGRMLENLGSADEILPLLPIYQEIKKECSGGSRPSL